MHFNPESLVYSVENSVAQQSSGPKKVQYVAQFSGKLTMDLQFDTTDTGCDVRTFTNKVALFMQASGNASAEASNQAASGGKAASSANGGSQGTPAKAPPVLQFQWGTYIFKGIMDSFKETIDFFSAEGVALRALVSIGLSRQDQVFDEGAKLIAAVKQSGKVCQTGTQQRSGAHYRRAKGEIFEKGKLGKVIFARAVWHDFPWQRRKIEPQPKPDGLDWDRFLGPAPKVSYEWIRYDSWRYFPDYGGGLLADILTHLADVAQWMMDESRPLNAVATGGIYQMQDGRVNPDTVNAILQYAGAGQARQNGAWNLTFESSVLPLRNERPGVFFQGTEGALEITRAEYIFTPNKGEPQLVKAEGNLEVAHATDFLEAIKHGKSPSADIQTGVEACNPAHLAKAAYWQRKRMKLDTSGARLVADV